MKIQRTSNQNFGRIIIDETDKKLADKAKKNLFDTIHSSSGPIEAYQEFATDILDIQYSDKNNVYVKADGSVFVKSEFTDNRRSEMIANGFLERFLLGLRSARSEVYQQYLHNYQEGRRNPIDV